MGGVWNIIKAKCSRAKIIPRTVLYELNETMHLLT